MRNNENQSQSPRRVKAHVSIIGTTQFHLRNPIVIAWWSAAFPGFGHLLLNKYLRGILLFSWEVIININSEINLALVHSFCGDFDLAKAALNPRWTTMYIPVYLFAIWDSYRTTVDMNKVCLLAERENAPFNSFSLKAIELNYLDKRSPVMSGIWSLFMPGLGQLYLHRIIMAFFSLLWSITFLYFSHALEAVHYLFLGEIERSTAILDKQWFLNMPSMWGFAAYDAYVNTVENNKLFNDDQRQFLIENYQDSRFKIKRGRVLVP